jgi:hypothetical protein
MKKKHPDPPIGNVYQHRHKGVVHFLTVVKTEDGVGFELNGTVYRSPTAAAKAIVGKHQQTNGRKFWHVD